jgi:hypothetical protein
MMASIYLVPDAARGNSHKRGLPCERNVWSLDRSLALLQEARCWAAVNDTVIEGQTQRHHLADCDGLSFLIQHDRASDDTSKAEDRALREIDDRGEGIDLEHSQVGDGERAAGEVSCGGDTAPRSVDQTRGLRRDRMNRFSICVANDGDQQPAFGIDRDADVN